MRTRLNEIWIEREGISLQSSSFIYHRQNYAIIGNSRPWDPEESSGAPNSAVVPEALATAGNCAKPIAPPFD